MPEQNYCWKRFWCPRSGSVNLTDGGYLYDPDSEWGKTYNPDLVSLEELTEIPCLVLLGEPGIGKSKELKKLESITKEQICKLNKTLFRDLRSCTDPKNDLFKDDIFLDWLESNYELYLFLDSFDEGLLSVPKLASILIDELQKSKYRDFINRLHLRLACRTFVFSSQLQLLEEGLGELWGEDHVEIHKLCPLRRVDVVEAVNKENFCSSDFLQELAQKEAVPLAIKPITLKFLLNRYRYHKGQFLPDQRLHELYLEGCKCLCEEGNKSRQASNELGDLDSNQRLIIAARIAAVTIFANRFSVWTGTNLENIPTEDIDQQILCLGSESANGKPFEISRKAIKEVFSDTGLFTSRGQHRMGWAHQTYAEFLAAWYLKQHDLDLSHILSLILHPDGRIIPQLQETTAWLASMRADVFQKVMETDPDVLLNSNLATVEETTKKSLIESLLKLHDEDKLVYQYRFNSYTHLNHLGLSDQLKAYICNPTKSIYSRHLAIDITRDCNLQALEHDLLNIVLDKTQNYWLRTHAMSVLLCVSNDRTKAHLRVFILGTEDDVEDELKGYALKTLYPNQITMEEVLNHLTQPKAKYIGGVYQDFIAKNLGEMLTEFNLFDALNWLNKQPLRRDLRYPFGIFSDSIILKAWEYIDNIIIRSSFAQIALKRLKEYDHLIDPHFQEVSFQEQLNQHDVKRRQLLETIISIIPESEQNYFWLLGDSIYSEKLVLNKDYSWLIEKLEISNPEYTQSIYSELIYYSWRNNSTDVDIVDAVLIAVEENRKLREKFSSEIGSIQLYSSKAKELQIQYKKYLEDVEAIRQERKQKLLEPAPEQRILDCLEEYEKGTTSSWVNLCFQLTLTPISTNYSSPFNTSISTLPGWKEAQEKIKERIIKAAREYIYQAYPETDHWLGTNSCLHSVLAAYQAIDLLLINDPTFISTLPANIWEKWTAIILDSPYIDNLENTQFLIKQVYKYASEEFIRVLSLLVDKENDQNGFIRIHEKIECCWDEHLEQVLLNKIQSNRIKAQGMGDLLKSLLIHQVAQAKVFAESIIAVPLPTEGEVREKASMAAQMLLRYSDDAGWPVVWKAIQQDTEFGKKVLESVSYASKYDGDIDHRLNSDNVADLYIFLTQQYPDGDTCNHAQSEENTIAGSQANIIRPKDSVKMWRGYLPQRLQERGTQEACDAFRKIIDELPELKENLQRRLLETESLVRRQTWIPFAPEDILQLVIHPEPSNSDLSDQLNTIKETAKEMQDDPKTITNNITNSTVNAPVGNTGETHSSVSGVQPVLEQSNMPTAPNPKKEINWGLWIAIFSLVLGIVSIPIFMSVSGAFNQEFKQWFSDVLKGESVEEISPSQSE